MAGGMVYCAGCAAYAIVIHDAIAMFTCAEVLHLYVSFSLQRVDTMPDSIFKTGL